MRGLPLTVEIYRGRLDVGGYLLCSRGVRRLAAIRMPLS
jgi:hypothetical protein